LFQEAIIQVQLKSRRERNRLSVVECQKANERRDRCDRSAGQRALLFLKNANDLPKRTAKGRLLTHVLGSRAVLIDDAFDLIGIA
jgi:hypothetical protein